MPHDRATGEVRPLPMRLVRPDPDQPRKQFDPDKLRELAASIRENGLLQPIVVRRDGEAYVIIAGERRYRAHQLIEAETVLARIVEIAGADVFVAQIVENMFRADVTPLEEAAAFQKAMDENGWSVEELARRLGMRQPWRITERTSLLKLAPDYRDLLAKGQLSPSQAFELSRLGPRGQATLFRQIKAGRCPSYADLRAAATALLEAEAQLGMFGASDLPPPASEEQRRAARGFEDRVQRLAAMLNAAIVDNEIVAVGKVDPNRAASLADLLGAMQKDLRRVETALRQAAIAADLFQPAA